MRRTGSKLSRPALVALTWLMLALPVAAWAQSPAPQTAATISQEVTIIIERQQVRFTAQRAVEQMQLQVFNQSGETVFDSGPVTVSELAWPFQNIYGQTLKSGLYAYTFSIKEIGATEARVRRGHFIVDRAQDRDGGADRLWVTGQGEGGVGTELTVARDENATVAGAVINNERTTGQRSEPLNRDGDGRKVEAQTQSQTAATKEAAADGVWTQEGNVVRLNNFESRVGIGTFSPSGKLDIWTLQGEYGFVHTGFLTPSIPQIKLATYVGANFNGTVSGGWLGTRSNHPLHFFTNNGQASLTVATSGNIGLGATSPAVPLHVSSGWGRLRVESTQDNVWSTVELKTPAREWHAGVGGPNLSNDIRNKYYIRDHTIGADRLVIDSAGNVGFGTLNPQARLHVVGTTITGTLQINNGSDFSENFDINPPTPGSEAKIEAGLVVAIDPARPGKLALSARAYDRRVVGVISGAGGVKPGMVMGQEGTLADGQHPVALSGRVYVWVDAARGVVKPGDLLTTSATPGYAMKATNSTKAQGAIIGKAMTGLKSGKGLVLVLVTLQ